MKKQIISKSKAFNKLIKAFISRYEAKRHLIVLNLAFLAVITGCGSPGATKIDDNSYYQLEDEVAVLINSSVADAAPLEMKFIQQKLQLAKQAKADRKRGLEAQYTEQIHADIKIAKLRAELNQKNNQLLNKRDQVSAAQVYQMELQERLQ
ncbi:hypothetical protein MNBD_GAMMA02-1288 [hydrothermal vent metagenome]|uniref:DUF4398 domain-containing protein n=1 Tax=hydrothermal vent metagenome TaxID=652676 RepID=A0A3B0WA84_9ZZZZ